MVRAGGAAILVWCPECSKNRVSRPHQGVLNINFALGRPVDPLKRKSQGIDEIRRRKVAVTGVLSRIYWYRLFVAVDSLLRWLKTRSCYDGTLVAAMQQIADWLKKLGVSEYAERFAEEDIDLELLPENSRRHTSPT